MGVADEAKRNGGGGSVAGIGSGHHVKESAKIGDGAGHGADDSDPGKCACAGRKMSGGGNSAGCGLETADAGEVRGKANGAATVAADSAHGATGSDCRGFTAAGAARGAREIPGIAGFAGDAIVGFVGHEKFGRVGAGHENRSSGAQACDEDGVVFGDVVFAEQ